VVHSSATIFVLDAHEERRAKKGKKSIRDRQCDRVWSRRMRDLPSIRLGFGNTERLRSLERVIVANSIVSTGWVSSLVVQIHSPHSVAAAAVVLHLLHHLPLDNQTLHSQSGGQSVTQKALLVRTAW
jgi:hypothetical protein